MKSYLRALSFLTVIPLPFVRFGSGGRELSAAGAAFPLAGATIGLLLAGLAWLLTVAVPAGPAAVAVLAASFLLTRGLHLDGLADTADGLIGTTGREKAFKAMADSAIGVMGVVVVLLVLLAKVFFLIEIGRQAMPAALFIMPLAGRWAIVFAGAWFQPAREGGLGELFLSGLGPLILFKASIGAVLLLAALFLLMPAVIWPVSAGCLAALGSVWLLSVYASRRLGGLTGDILGAAAEIGELLFLAGFYLVLQNFTAAF